MMVDVPLAVVLRGNQLGVALEHVRGDILGYRRSLLAEWCYLLPT
jgi:hypothetical protein